MFEKRFRQLTMFEADNLYQNLVERDTFYGFLAALRGRIFTDEQFADLYGSDSESPSVPPSLLATALLLQCHDCVSDEEAKARADYDIRWKYALGIGLVDQPFAKSTLKSFRRRMIRHGKVQARFQPSLDLAREQARPKIQNIKAVLGSNVVLDQAVVKDMYNLVGDVIAKMIELLEKGKWFIEVG